LAPRCADTVGKRFALETIIQLFAERTKSEAFQGNVAKGSAFTEEHCNFGTSQRAFRLAQKRVE
jgi:hypothetical protein